MADPGTQDYCPADPEEGHRPVAGAPWQCADCGGPIWAVILTETGVNSVWPSDAEAVHWYYVLAGRGYINPGKSVVAPFDHGDEAHCMAASFSPQLNQR